VTPAAVPEIGDAVVPVLRLLDRTSGADSIVAEGACNPVWSSDGRLAYVRGAVADGIVGPPYLGRVVVRERGGSLSTWTETVADYLLAAWAGETLLAYRRSGFPSSRSDLVLLAAGGQAQPAGPGASVVAVRPDGLRALISTIPATGTNSSERATLRLIRLPDGVELSSLRLDPELEDLGRDGSWAGDEIIASVGVFPGGISHPNPALILVSVASDSLSIAAEFHFDARLIGPGPFVTVTTPFFIDGTHVGALWSWASARYLSCDTGARTCSLGPELGQGTVILRQWLKDRTRPTRGNAPQAVAV